MRMRNKLLFDNPKKSTFTVSSLACTTSGQRQCGSCTANMYEIIYTDTYLTHIDLPFVTTRYDSSAVRTRVTQFFPAGMSRGLSGTKETSKRFARSRPTPVCMAVSLQTPFYFEHNLLINCWQTFRSRLLLLNYNQVSNISRYNIPNFFNFFVCLLLLLFIFFFFFSCFN